MGWVLIISHKHRYLFVEVPRTGSTAISAELREHYGGESILKKHSYYSTFLRQASEDEKTYRVISGVRNPLDDAVSRYQKLATRPREYFARSRRNLKRFDEVNERGLSFSEFLHEFHRLPFDLWTSTYHRTFAKIIRFENLQQDFADAISMLGTPLVRSLPEKNKTLREKDFVSYYAKEDIAHAVWIFGPYMQAWGYAFPDEWGVQRVPSTSKVLYRLLKRIRATYWNHIRQGDGLSGRLFRKAFLE